MNRVALGVLSTFVLVLLGSGLLTYVWRDRSPVAERGGAAQSGLPPATASQ